MRDVYKGDKDVSVVIRIVDSTTFLPETAVEHNTSGIDLWFRREGATKTTITEVALAALNTAHTDGGIEHIGDGYYRVDPPDAAFADGVSGVMIGGAVTGMMITGCYVALKDRVFETGKIYVDASGTNSTVYPYGNARHPTNTIANGKTIADANNLDVFVCHGNLTMSADMEDYTFEGHGHMAVANRIFIDSQSVEHSVFKELVVQGTMTNATGVLNVTRFQDCQLWALADIHGLAFDGSLLGACSILDGGMALFHNVGCGALAACTLTIQAPVLCVIDGMKGVLTIAGMDGGTASISMAPGSTLTLDNTNTSGTLTVSGDTSGLTDNSDGTTVVVTGCLDKLNAMGWVAFGDFVINKATGDFVFYKDDGVTPGLTGNIGADSTSTSRLFD